MSKKTLFCLACEMPVKFCTHKKGTFLQVTEEEFVALLGKKPALVHLANENQQDLRNLFNSFK